MALNKQNICLKCFNLLDHSGHNAINVALDKSVLAKFDQLGRGEYLIRMLEPLGLYNVSLNRLDFLPDDHN